MSASQALRPTLVVNGRLIRDFMATSTPCCTLGLLEERGKPGAFFALSPHESIRPRDVGRTFSHGHALLGAYEREVIQFGFTFFESWTYHVLINPNNPVVSTLLDGIIERRYYFVFMIDPDNRMTAFRADLTRHNLALLTGHRHRTRRSTTTDAQYRAILARFRLKPRPPGRVLEWVCRDGVDYLDLTQHRLDVFPAG